MGNDIWFHLETLCPYCNNIIDSRKYLNEIPKEILCHKCGKRVIIKQRFQAICQMKVAGQ